MSEEILKALMQLFALITKQDGGIGEKEIAYVNRFLVQQIGVDSATEYLKLYRKPPRMHSCKEPNAENEKKLTSVLDSVRCSNSASRSAKPLTSVRRWWSWSGSWN